jgi:hypothetical protein
VLGDSHGQRDVVVFGPAALLTDVHLFNY